MNTYREYLKKGLSVFPVAGPRYAKEPTYKAQKKPLVDWGIYQDRHPTEAEILLWESKWPGAWIGCATGPISGIIVIDIDGELGLKTLREKNLPLPATWVAKTPRGFHYFFKWDDALAGYVTTASAILPGIDVRGKGGFVILPSENEDRQWKLYQQS